MPGIGVDLLMGYGITHPDVSAQPPSITAPLAKLRIATRRPASPELKARWRRVRLNEMLGTALDILEERAHSPDFAVRFPPRTIADK